MKNNFFGLLFTLVNHSIFSGKIWGITCYKLQAHSWHLWMSACLWLWKSSTADFHSAFCSHTFVSVCSVTQLCLTLCDALDWSLPASSVHGISCARILEWVAISFSRRLNGPRDRLDTSKCSSYYKSEYLGSCVLTEWILIKILKGDFPGSPVVKTPCFQCREYGFDPWSEN